MFGICYGGFWAVAAPMLALLHSVRPERRGPDGNPRRGRHPDRARGRPLDRSHRIAAGGAGGHLLDDRRMGRRWASACWSIAAIVVGAMLLDIGLRAAMVANQTLINSAVPDSRARANTLFGLHVWSGNATGAFLASWAFAQFGWLAVCGVAMTASIIALLIHLYGVPFGEAD